MKRFIIEKAVGKREIFLNLVFQNSIWIFKFRIIKQIYFIKYQKLLQQASGEIFILGGIKYYIGSFGSSYTWRIHAQLSSKLINIFFFKGRIREEAEER